MALVITIPLFSFSQSGMGSEARQWGQLTICPLKGSKISVTLKTPTKESSLSAPSILIKGSIRSGFETTLTFVRSGQRKLVKVPDGNLSISRGAFYDDPNNFFCRLFCERQPRPQPLTGRGLFFALRELLSP